MIGTEKPNHLTTAANRPRSRTARSAALRQPGYAAYLTGTMLAMMADSIEHVISYWVIYEKFKSPALGGYAVISHWAPFLFFSIWSGALADRYRSAPHHPASAWCCSCCARSPGAC